MLAFVRFVGFWLCGHVVGFRVYVGLVDYDWLGVGSVRSWWFGVVTCWFGCSRFVGLDHLLCSSFFCVV